MSALVATHGEPSDQRERLVEDWVAHVAGGVDAGARQLGLLAQLPASVVRHSIARLRHGSPTAIPAALLLAATGLSSASLVFTDDLLPARAHLLMALALLALAFVFARWPNGQPSRPFGLAIGVLAAACAYTLTIFTIERPSDWLIVVGGGLIASLLPLGATLAVRPSAGLRRTCIVVLAIGVTLIGLSNIDWWGASLTPAFALTCLVSGSFCLLTAHSLFRIRDLA